MTSVTLEGTFDVMRFEFPMPPDEVTTGTPIGCFALDAANSTAI